MFAFLFAFLLGLGFLQLGVALGVFGGLCFHQPPKNAALKAVYFAVNIAAAAGLCYAIAWGWAILQINFEQFFLLHLWDLEPVSFGVVYGGVYFLGEGLFGLARLVRAEKID